MNLPAMLLSLCLLAEIGSASEAPPVETTEPPTTPWRAAEGGVVIVELSVNASGVVEGVRPLRGTPPYSAEVVRAVSRWTFQPLATAEQEAMAHVLVVAVFRSNTLPGTPMAHATDTAQPTVDVPFPRESPPPPYPVSAVGDGVVVLEVQVDAEGRVAEARIISGDPPFVGVSDATVRKWTFRPARAEGTGKSARAYVVFSFREPIVVPTSSSPPARSAPSANGGARP